MYDLGGRRLDEIGVGSFQEMLDFHTRLYTVVE